MRFEDPGWDDYVPLPEDQQKEAAGQKPSAGGQPPTSGPPSKPPRTPWWRSRSGIALGLGVAAVAVVVAVAAAGGGGGGGGGGGSTTPIDDPSITSTPETTPTPTGSTSTGPTTSTPSRTEGYLAEANSVCANHRPKILTAFSAYASSGDPSGVIPPLQALQADLQALGPPTGEGTDTYLDDLDRWIKAFQEGDVQGAQIWQSAMGPHSTEAGLQSCPPN